MIVIKSLDKSKKLFVAVSGGIDSVATVFYFKRRGFDVTAVHYDHGNDFSQREFEFVTKFCSDYNIDLITDKSTLPKLPEMSQEEFWAKSRHDFFNSLPGLVATGHNLNDAVEWYLFTSLNGEGRVFEYQIRNVIRPFILQPKSKLVDFLNRYNLPFIHDDSNDDVNFARRNMIRHKLLPIALEVNPGLFGMVRRKIAKKHVINEKLEKQK